MGVNLFDKLFNWFIEQRYFKYVQQEKKRKFLEYVGVWLKFFFSNPRNLIVTHEKKTQVLNTREAFKNYLFKILIIFLWKIKRV